MTSLEEKLKQRKLGALKRGVHRLGGEAGLAFNVHLVGVGKAGADVVAGALRALPREGLPMSALVVDVGDGDLAPVREAAAALPAGRADVQTLALAELGAAELASTFENYGRFLKLEYPMFPWALDGQGWLPAGKPLSEGGSLRRAYAKALYGRAYYDGDRPAAEAIRRFGRAISDEPAQSIVCVVFGMGGAGGGIVVDLARHLVNVALARQALVIGLGVMPCDGDAPRSSGGALYAALNEFDCLGDEGKNHGVVRTCGELFRNPFTAGLLLAPQQGVWAATGDLSATHAKVDAELVALLTGRGGANLMEALRMLNWVAAPSTQHSAARTPWGDKWIHLLGFADLAAPGVSGKGLRRSLGVLDAYRPEFVEIRVPSASLDAAETVAAAITEAFAPETPPQSVGEGVGSAQFVLPSLRKTDLAAFGPARAAYEAENADDRLLDHALLLEQGIVLSEPSQRMPGMTGAALRGGAGWIAVAMEALAGGESLQAAS
ncbi:hypothetical protein [Methylopila sp. 73B]|uniref:hypothetical protein n=1 Tax=Methylopila sp. 73B TaxID=1120792 RepID=UPI000378C653|nr:hypothetical protein [Methylopila sp. 73B]